jgi:hypothetical protein
VIKIRYADLPGGLHVRAEARGQDTIIYLLPGLTEAQRRAALHRVRSSARVGHGPRLPAAGLARAVAADRARTTARNAFTALRVHPALSVPLIVIIMSAAFAYALLVSGTVRGQSPQASGPGAALDAPVVVTPWLSRGFQPRVPGHRRARPARPGRPSPGPSGVVATPAPQPSGRVTASPSPSPSQHPAAPKPKPSASASPPSPSPSPSPSSSGSPAGTGAVGHSGGLCLEFGPTGVCLVV